jgi:hypothetical protein
MEAQRCVTAGKRKRKQSDFFLELKAIRRAFQFDEVFRKRFNAVSGFKVLAY